MNGRVLRLADIDAQDISRWQELSVSAVEPNPLFEPASLLPAVKYLPNGGEIKLVVAEDDGVFFGCLPMERSRLTRDRMLPTSLEMVFRGCTTQVRRNRYDQTPLLRPERTDEAWLALLEAVGGAGTRDRVSYLRLESINLDGPVEHALRNLCQDRGVGLVDLALWTRPVKLRSDGPGGRFSAAEMSKGDRRVRTYQRRLGEELGSAIRLVDRSDDAQVIDELVRLERSGYKFATGVAVESFEGELDWLSAVCDELRQQRRLYVYTLQADEKVVAMAMYFRAGDRLLTIHKAFDEEYKKFSPGVQLDLELFAELDSRPEIQMIDSCTRADAEDSYRRFTESRRVGTFLVATGGPTYGRILAAFAILRRPFLRVLSRLSESRRLRSFAHKSVVRIVPKVGRGKGVSSS